jgi:hypothetical protein
VFDVNSPGPKRPSNSVVPLSYACFHDSRSADDLRRRRATEHGLSVDERWVYRVGSDQAQDASRRGTGIRRVLTESAKRAHARIRRAGEITRDETRDGRSATAIADRPSTRNHSIRRPEIAREMTSCWICSVPSKMSWLTFTGFVNAAQCCHVPLTRAFAKHQFTECR